jgi:hypothetical protein
LFDYDLIAKIGCFNVNGATTFQGIKAKVSTKLKKKFEHHFLFMCIA